MEATRLATEAGALEEVAAPAVNIVLDSGNGSVHADAPMPGAWIRAEVGVGLSACDGLGITLAPEVATSSCTGAREAVAALHI